MWVLLAAALAFLPFRRYPAIFLLSAAVAWAYFQGVLTLYAIGFLIACAVIARTARAPLNKQTLAVVREAALVLASLALFLHKAPGFSNPKILDGVAAGAHSAPLTLYFNFDKAIIPFLLLAALPTLFYYRRSSTQPRWHWLLLIISVPLLLLLAVGAGGLAIEPHNPPWLWTFILANLFFVSLAEEALFRGYLQQRLSGWLGNYASLFITAAIFGAAHIGGGALLAIFAGLAGVIYGLGWLWSGRLWVATLFHFALNLLHLLFFTYPFYQR